MFSVKKRQNRNQNIKNLRQKSQGDYRVLGLVMEFSNIKDKIPFCSLLLVLLIIKRVLQISLENTMKVIY